MEEEQETSKQPREVHGSTLWKELHFPVFYLAKAEIGTGNLKDKDFTFCFLPAGCKGPMGHGLQQLETLQSSSWFLLQYNSLKSLVDFLPV